MNALALSLLVFGVIQQYTRWIYPPLFLAGMLGVLGVAFRGRVRELTSVQIMTLAGLFFASLMLAAAPYVLISHRVSFVNFAHAAGLAVVPWAFAFVLWRRTARPEAAAVPSQPQSARIAGGLVVAFGLLALAHWRMRGALWFTHDELLYVLQGRLMTEPGFARQLDPSLSRFFVLPQTFMTDRGLVTQYPPGQPALLALFDAVGLRWWSGVVASTLGVVFTYLLGRDLFSRSAGLMAAALLTTNVYFLQNGPGYMAHGAGIALTTGAAWLTHRGLRSSGAQQLWWLVGAGFLLGSFVAVRPLSGAAMTLTIVAWQFVLTRPDRHTMVRLFAFFAAGSVLPISALLMYNSVTTGSPLLFGYTALHGSLHDLGFGERGFMQPGNGGQYIKVAEYFGPKLAVIHAVESLEVLVSLLNPALILALPLGIIAAREGMRIRYGAAAAFLVLPAAYFFYFYHHPRFFLELFPFLFIAIAGFVSFLRIRYRTMAVTVVAALLIAQVATAWIGIQGTTASIGIQGNIGRRDSAMEPGFDAIQRELTTAPHLLVFAAPKFHFVLSWLNIDSFPGKVIVARDLGVENALLMKHYPGHVPIRIDSTGRVSRLNPAGS